MATVPIRVDRALFETAKATGELHGRSAAQQLDHWTRIGRELESSRPVDWVSVSRALAGAASYDQLGDPEQTVVRASWRDQIAKRIGELDLTEPLRAAGQPWPEADADGDVGVRR